MFELFSSLLKYVFITIIYAFIFGIMRLIYLDIRSMNNYGNSTKNVPYLKLINRTELLNFKVEETYVLDEDKTIGRSKKCDIVIADPFLSSEHLKVTSENGTYYIEDLNSTNGTFLNGHRIGGQPVELKNGDKISIGQMDFLFVSSSKQHK